MHLQSIVNFRALAILFIVAGHSYGLAGISIEGFMNRALGNIVTGGTSYFVFISGYMFHHVFYERFDYRTFVTSKIKFVLVPYLIISTTYALQLEARKSEIFLGGFSVFQGDGLSEHIEFTLQIVLYGKAFWAFWYVPFVMLLFSLSLLHVKFLELSRNKQLGIMLAATLFALVAHRPTGNLDAVHSVVSFTPAYFLGMLCSQNRTKLLEFSDIFLPISLGLGLAILLLQTQLGHVGNYHKDQIFSFDGLDLMLLQKLFFSIALFLLLEQTSSIDIKFVNWISATSFTIFFLHGWLIQNFTRMDFSPLIGMPWVELAVWTTLTSSICSVIAFTGRKLLKRNSRFFLGY